MAKTIGRRKSKRSKGRITRKSKSRKNYMKKGGFIIDASKVHPASIILSK
jgi:hypothetical protein